MKLAATAEVIEVNHPLLKEQLSKIRSVETASPDFRRAVKLSSIIMAMAATADLATKTVTVQTPIAEARCEVLERSDFVIIPILRAGLGMVDGLLELLPHARVGHVGLQRNEVTLEAHEYYLKIPDGLDKAQVFVVDPMLATGGSARVALDHLKAHGAKDITLLTLIAAPEGIETVHAHHPDVPIVVAAVDQGLNEHGYIVPGLGDAGDRFFGTL